MRHIGQTLFVLIVGIFCLAGNANAQRSRSATNANIKQRVSPSAAAQIPRQPLAPPGYLETPSTFAVMGAVRKPGIYTTTLATVTVANLIQSAGGVTPESNGTLRVYENGHSQAESQLEREAQNPVLDGQVLFVSSKGGSFGPKLTVNQGPYRPVVITGLGTAPVILNLSDRSQDVEGLVRMLGQPREVMGHDQFAAVWPQRGWLSASDMLRPNTIVHFPPEAVNHEGVVWALQNGLKFEPVLPVLTEAASPAVQEPLPQQPGPAVPPEKLSAPMQTSDLVPGLLDPQIEPAGSLAPSAEPSRFRLFGDPADESDDAKERDADQEPESRTGRPPIMMRPEWSTFGTDSGEDVDEDRKIERTSAQREPVDPEIILAAAELPAATPEVEPQPLQLTSESAPSQRGVPFAVESWIALGIVLGAAGLSFVLTRVLSQEDRRLKSRIEDQRRQAPDADSAEPVREFSETNEDQRFLQRLVINQIPLVEEEPTLPPVEHLHGMAIGGRRMVLHEAHEQLAGPHFAVRQPGDTRPMERRLRTVLRDTATHRHEAAVVTRSEPSHVRTAVSPLERALRSVDRGSNH